MQSRSETTLSIHARVCRPSHTWHLGAPHAMSQVSEPQPPPPTVGKLRVASEVGESNLRTGHWNASGHNSASAARRAELRSMSRHDQPRQGCYVSRGGRDTNCSLQFLVPVSLLPAIFSLYFGIGQHVHAYGSSTKKSKHRHSMGR